jgi:hypothetical protein
VQSFDPAANEQDDSLALACNSDPRENRGLGSRVPVVLLSRSELPIQVDPVIEFVV